jgi:hypothetical protein
MKPAPLSCLLLLLLVRCTEPGVEGVATNLLVGSWKNAETGFVVNFDANQIYSVRFGADTTFFSAYKLSIRKNQNRLFIYDSAVTNEYRFKFLGPDQLTLTQIFPASFVSEIDNNTVFRRLK